MRGLDSRVMWAQARITAYFDSGLADGMFYNLMDEAFVLGMRDARKGVDQVPLLFAGEKHLSSCWLSGFQSEREQMAMDGRLVRRCDAAHPCSMRR